MNRKNDVCWSKCARRTYHLVIDLFQLGLSDLRMIEPVIKHSMWEEKRLSWTFWRFFFSGALEENIIVFKLRIMVASNWTFKINFLLIKSLVIFSKIFSIVLSVIVLGGIHHILDLLTQFWGFATILFGSSLLLATSLILRRYAIESLILWRVPHRWGSLALWAPASTLLNRNLWVIEILFWRFRFVWANFSISSGLDWRFLGNNLRTKHKLILFVLLWGISKCLGAASCAPLIRLLNLLMAFFTLHGALALVRTTLLRSWALNNTT